jgi:hypothetical protein
MVSGKVVVLAVVVVVVVVVVFVVDVAAVEESGMGVVVVVLVFPTGRSSWNIMLFDDDAAKLWLTVVTRISECNVNRRTAPRATRTAALLWFTTRAAMVAVL